MKIIIALVGLVLAMWVDLASSREIKKAFEMTVARHKSVQLSDGDVDKIFAEASKILKKCKVKLSRKGSIGTFEAPKESGEIGSTSDRDAVFKENFDIKIVPDEAVFCRPRIEDAAAGCTWDAAPGEQKPQHKSGMIIINRTPKISGAILAHEFGHMTGLWHRSEKTALMTACPVEHLVRFRHVQINKKECGCIFRGPRSCHDDEPVPRKECDPVDSF
jgi:hypothetical protein